MVEASDSQRAFAPLFVLERARLLDLLRSLEATDWQRPTPCPGWNVLGLAAHILGDDLSLLAWQRDDHHGTPTPDGLSEPGFITWLDELQIEWVHAARRLSPRLVVELLDWTDVQVGETVSVQDSSALTATVSWASLEPVPVWLDQARELSERWIHRQQILQALGHPSDLRRDLAAPVLDALRWVYPFRLGSVRRRAGATAVITVTGPELEIQWQLVSDGDAWHFSPSVGDSLIAELQMSTDQGWRLLSNNLDPEMHGEVVTSGDAEIVATLRRSRAIIGSPK